jgi:hypothetical protein
VHGVAWLRGMGSDVQCVLGRLGAAALVRRVGLRGL